MDRPALDESFQQEDWSHVQSWAGSNPSFNVVMPETEEGEENIRKTQERDQVSLQEIIAQTPPLRLFEAYANQALVTPDLAGEGPFTLFPPWDVPWGNVEPVLVSKLQNPFFRAHLRNLVHFHLYTDEELTLDNLQGTRVITAANGESLKIDRGNGTSRVFVYDVLVVAPYDATNGFAVSFSGRSPTQDGCSRRFLSHTRVFLLCSLCWTRYSCPIGFLAPCKA